MKIKIEFASNYSSSESLGSRTGFILHIKMSKYIFKNLFNVALVPNIVDLASLVPSNYCFGTVNTTL